MGNAHQKIEGLRAAFGDVSIVGPGQALPASLLSPQFHVVAQVAARRGQSSQDPDLPDLIAASRGWLKSVADSPEGDDGAISTPSISIHDVAVNRSLRGSLYDVYDAAMQAGDLDSALGALALLSKLP